MAKLESFRQAIWNQPTTLEVAAAAIESSLHGVSIAPWRTGETVGIVAMGASTNSGHAIVAALAGQGVRAVNLNASDVVHRSGGFEPADHYLIVSESGRSPEPIAAARSLPAGRRIGITNHPEAAIGQVTDVTVGFGGIPDSPVYTCGYIATLVAYSAVMESAGVACSFVGGAVPRLVRSALARYSGVAEQVAEVFDGTGACDFIGRHHSYASAAQGALMFREALRVSAASFESYQYLHGPMEAAGTRTGLVVFGEGRELDIVLAQAEAGVKVLVVAAPNEKLAYIAHRNIVIAQIPEGQSGLMRVISETVLLQLVVDALARRRGMTVGDFLYEQPDTKLSETAGEFG